MLGGPHVGFMGAPGSSGGVGGSGWEWVTGRWYPDFAFSSSTISLPGWLYVAPVWIPSALHITTLALQFQNSSSTGPTGGQQGARFGLYTDATGPHTLVWGSAFHGITWGVTATWVKTAVSLTLAPGFYWRAFLTQAIPTFTATTSIKFMTAPYFTSVSHPLIPYRGAATPGSTTPGFNNRTTLGPPVSTSPLPTPCPVMLTDTLSSAPAVLWTPG